MQFSGGHVFSIYIEKLNESLRSWKSKISLNDKKARDWVNPGLCFFFLAMLLLIERN